MNQEKITSLIDALAASDLSELEYTENGCTLRLSKNALAPREASAESTPQAADRTPESDAHAPQAAAQCLAPLYGVVHLQPAPGEAAFVAAGQQVKAGRTLCVIEAMKVFNEVRAEADCRVLAVLVESGAEVESGQALFSLAAMD